MRCSSLCSDSSSARSSSLRPSCMSADIASTVPSGAPARGGRSSAEFCSCALPMFRCRVAFHRSTARPIFSLPFRAFGERMTDIIAQLATGFVHCMTPLNLAMLVVGIVIGLLIGVLPGLTLVMGVALALPFTYKMDVTASIVLLTAMYVSGTYGGAFTAILFRIPGEPIDVPMLWDGYTMGRKGKPAKALGWTLVAALGGGLLSAIVMVALTQPLAQFALRFSSPEYFVIVMFGLLSVVAIGKGSLANAFISMSVGILISTVGTDPISGAYRFTF